MTRIPIYLVPGRLGDRSATRLARSDAEVGISILRREGDMSGGLVAAVLIPVLVGAVGFVLLQRSRKP